MKQLWLEYRAHPWASKMVAVGIGLEMAAIWIGGWFL